jgi:hypothetical protein
MPTNMVAAGTAAANPQLGLRLTHKTAQNMANAPAITITLLRDRDQRSRMNTSVPPVCRNANKGKMDSGRIIVS